MSVRVLVLQRKCVILSSHFHFRPECELFFLFLHLEIFFPPLPSSSHSSFTATCCCPLRSFSCLVLIFLPHSPPPCSPSCPSLFVLVRRSLSFFSSLSFSSSLPSSSSYSQTLMACMVHLFQLLLFLSTPPSPLFHTPPPPLPPPF